MTHFGSADDGQHHLQTAAIGKFRTTQLSITKANQRWWNKQEPDIFIPFRLPPPRRWPRANSLYPCVCDFHTTSTANRPSNRVRNARNKENRPKLRFPTDLLSKRQKSQHYIPPRQLKGSIDHKLNSTTTTTTTKLRRFPLSLLPLLLIFLLSTTLCLALIAGGTHTKKTLKEQDIIQRVLKGYDWRVRPRGRNESHGDAGGPVVVSVNLYMRSISKIDDVNMEYSSQFTFREEWWDPRLAYDRFADEDTEVPPFVVLAMSEQQDSSQQIWMPDTFFQNEKEARRHLIDKPNVLIRIHSNGNILYSVRLSLVLSCPMKLEYYPLDKQTCLIDMASYAYTTDDIKYEWKVVNPVQLKDGLRQSLPSFELQDVTTSYCSSKTNTGEYSCVRVQLNLRREYSYYLIQLYIPCIMLVVVSWVSFWLDKDAVPARVSLGVTTLLTMTTQASGINSKLPPVSYIKAVDVWIGSCLAFIFSALLEYALVNYHGRREFMRKERSKTAGLSSSVSGGSGPAARLSNAFFSTGPDPNSNYIPAIPPASEQVYNATTITAAEVGGGIGDPTTAALLYSQQKRSVAKPPLLPLGVRAVVPPMKKSSISARRPSVRLDMVGGGSWTAAGGGMRRRSSSVMTPPTLATKIRRVIMGGGRSGGGGRVVELSKRVDIVSRYMFPLMFGAFLLFYYLFYVQ